MEIEKNERVLGAPRYTMVPDGLVKNLGISKGYFVARLIRWRQYTTRKDIEISNAVLAEECQTSESQVKRWKKELQEQGLLEYHTERPGGERNTTTKYKLNEAMLNELCGWDIFEVPKTQVEQQPVQEKPRQKAGEELRIENNNYIKSIKHIYANK